MFSSLREAHAKTKSVAERTEESQQSNADDIQERLERLRHHESVIDQNAHKFNTDPEW
jgi:predicted nuclease with TOPRIM domain